MEFSTEEQAVYNTVDDNLLTAVRITHKTLARKYWTTRLPRRWRMTSPRRREKTQPP